MSGHSRQSGDVALAAGQRTRSPCFDVDEAAAEGKAKIGLLEGDTLVRLCTERGIGVDRRQVTPIELSPGDLAAE